MTIRFMIENGSNENQYYEFSQKNTEIVSFILE